MILKLQFFRASILLLFVFFAFNCYSQQYRKLTLDDFIGQVEENSSRDAYTSWRVSYRYKPSQQQNKYDFLVTLHFMSEKSWLRRDETTSSSYLQELLNHEQGHFAIGALMQQEVRRVLSEYTYTKNFKMEIDSLFREVAEKYKKMEINYDKETNHMKNKIAQLKWNSLFQKSNL